LDQLVLTARVVQAEGRYVARVDGLPVEGHGDSRRQAEDQLVQAMRAWIEAQDTTGRLAEALAQAGFPGADDDTELQLEFAE
jgi:predicted regulator of Ras-like GTPase activity (Roadblock/LC7/MglB family)